MDGQGIDMDTWMMIDNNIKKLNDSFLYLTEIEIDKLISNDIDGDDFIRHNDDDGDFIRHDDDDDDDDDDDNDKDNDYKDNGDKDFEENCNKACYDNFVENKRDQKQNLSAKSYEKNINHNCVINDGSSQTEDGNESGRE